MPSLGASRRAGQSRMRTGAAGTRGEMRARPRLPGRAPGGAVRAGSLRGGRRPSGSRACRGGGGRKGSNLSLSARGLADPVRILSAPGDPPAGGRRAGPARPPCHREPVPDVGTNRSGRPGASLKASGPGYGPASAACGQRSAPVVRPWSGRPEARAIRAGPVRAGLPSPRFGAGGAGIRAMRAGPVGLGTPDGPFRPRRRAGPSRAERRVLAPDRPGRQGIRTRGGRFRAGSWRGSHRHSRDGRARSSRSHGG